MGSTIFMVAPFLALISLRGALGGLNCEELPVETSEEIYEWIETEVCMDACGLDTMQVGMSSDGLLESEFTRKLCSAQCYKSCPNIVNLYSNLAAGEGLHLQALCEAQRTGSRRILADELPAAKSGITTVSFAFAAAPLSSDDINITASLASVRMVNQLGNCWECTCCEFSECSVRVANQVGVCSECSCCELIDC